MDGFGIHVSATGVQYYGNWLNSQRSGHGTLLYEDGTYYEGSFLQNKKHGKGKLCFPNGDCIEGQFANDEVHQARFVKGNFQEVSRPMRSFFSIQLELPIKLDERPLFLEKLKWIDYLQAHIFIPPDTSDRDLIIHEPFPGSSITNAIQYFSDLFLWNYSDTVNQAIDTKVKVALVKATDDITSFIEGLLDVIESKRAKSFSNTGLRKFRRKLTRVITTKLYSCLFTMYSIVYRIEDAHLAAKFSQLKDISPVDIGIDRRYALNDPSLSSSLIPSSPRKARPSSSKLKLVVSETQVKLLTNQVKKREKREKREKRSVS